MKRERISIFCRKYQSLENEEEIILDVNILAEGESYFEVGSAFLRIINWLHFQQIM
jgi:oligopeptidase B